MNLKSLRGFRTDSLDCKELEEWPVVLQLLCHRQVYLNQAIHGDGNRDRDDEDNLNRRTLIGVN